MKKTVFYTVALFAICSLASAQQYKVLWSFVGDPDGWNPVANLVFDRAGNLYGTTLYGGSTFGGTVFELSPSPNGSWTETVLYSFCSDKVGVVCLDGYLPSAGLVLDSAGNLYGSTEKGGDAVCPSDLNGCGTVFELSPPTAPGNPWTQSVLYSFCSDEANNRCLDGNFPLGQLVLDAEGRLYGTTVAGGTGHPIAYPNVGGVVFKLSRGATGWAEEVLYSFCSSGTGNACPDGAGPHSGVTFDKSGSLYGTTYQGGAPKSIGSGTVYKLTPGGSGWEEAVLHAFLSYERFGGAPLGAVSFDPRGNLYSTLEEGGTGQVGGVFRLTREGQEYTLSFDTSNGGNPMAGVVVDSKGPALYGTNSDEYVGLGGGPGNVFEITAAGSESVLYTFCSQNNCADGSFPGAALLEDKAGNLYGTTEYGGSGTFCPTGCGVVFEIVQSRHKP